MIFEYYTYFVSSPENLGYVESIWCPHTENISDSDTIILLLSSNPSLHFLHCTADQVLLGWRIVWKVWSCQTDFSQELNACCSQHDDTHFRKRPTCFILNQVVLMSWLWFHNNHETKALDSKYIFM